MSKNVLNLQSKRDGASSDSPVWRKILYIALWLVWLAMLGLLLFSLYLWSNRYELLEDQAQRLLAEKNIQADFEITTIERGKLRLDSIRLHDMNQPDEAPFFKAAQIEAIYDWREMLDGRVKSLRFVQPDAVIEIDAAGKIISGWLPPTQSDNQGALVFPKDGIEVERGTLKLISPYGDFISEVQASIKGPSQFDADLELHTAAIHSDNFKANIGGPLSVQAKGQTYLVTSKLEASAISSGVARARSGVMSADLNLIRGGAGWQIGGLMSLGLKGVETAQAIAENLDLKSNGTFQVNDAEKDGPLWERLDYKGDVDLRAQALKLTDSNLRMKAAQKISLANSLEKSPILREFAPSLTAQTQRLLTTFDVSAAVSASKTREGLQLVGRDVVQLSNAQSHWRVMPRGQSPLVDIVPDERAAGSYRGHARFDFEKTGALPLLIQDADLTFLMDSASKFGGVTGFAAQIDQPRAWEVTDENGQIARLTAPRSDVIFSRAEDITRFSAKTNFIITGQVPGGYVEGLSGQGTVKVESRDKNMKLDFSAAQPLNMPRMSLTSGWVLEDAQFNLATPFKLNGPAENRRAAFDVEALNTRMHDGADKNFAVNIGSVSGQGLLALKNDILSQIWDLNLQDGRVSSAKFPVEDTDIFSPLAEINVRMKEGESPIFDISSPTTMISSALVSTDDISVNLAGTPDDMMVDYDAKLFRFSDPALPEIPMRGRTHFVDERWTGASVAWLPEDLVTPIDISFAYEEGIGSADIQIKALQFKPKGLQPQNLVSNLRGKLAEVDGLVSASIKLGFGEGLPLTSSGLATIENMNLAIAAGPIAGLNTSLQFSSFFPLKTSGRQFVHLDGFDPGFPLPPGKIEFELLPGKMRIHSAEWPIAGGRIYIEPLIWDFEAQENRAELVIDQVAIQELMQRKADSKIEITGAVSGRLPVVITGVSVVVEDGKLSVPGGGVIRFTHEGTDLAGAQNQAAGIAFDALKNFQYKALEAEINGPLDGLIRLQTIFSGYNDKVFEGQPFEFDLELEGELMNLMRELNPETQKNRALSGNIVDLILKN